MAFVKLDCGILNSTLWVEREQRDIFITALLMAAPIELKEPMEQYEVDAIRTTGFVVPPGWYGFVEAAGPGIVRRALADMKQGMEALRKLGGPDEESRSSEFDGRRLVRVDGGYVVLNYFKYREKDNSAAVRSARYRARKKMLSAAVVTRDVTTVTRDSSRRVTIAEAEAEAEAKKKNTRAPKAPAATPDGFAEFWSAWPNTARKANKKGCLNAWAKHKHEERAQEIISHVEAMKQSRQWKDGYEPAPLTYLNQERWADGVATRDVQDNNFAGVI